jgi:hypothetical protein
MNFKSFSCKIEFLLKSLQYRSLARLSFSIPFSQYFSQKKLIKMSYVNKHRPLNTDMK